jgi:nucleoid-associated protein YgaU
LNNAAGLLTKFLQYTNADGTNAWCGRYEGGCRFRGRGAMQLTHRSNYANAGRALGQDFVSNPELVAQMPWAFLTAGWFWQTRDLNSFADRGDVVGATRVINGGRNGLEDRQARFAVAQRCIGGGSGTTPPPPPSADDNCQYTVRSGDTFGAIATRHDTTVANLQRLNPSITNPSLIRVGQVIIVC